MQTFFFKFFYLIPKNSLGFLIGKHPLLWFFAQRWLSYVHLYLLASEALHIGRIGNMTKPLWILYQLSRPILNFGYGRKSVTTLPHLWYIGMYRNITQKCAQQTSCLNILGYFLEHPTCAKKYKNRVWVTLNVGQYFWSK